MNENLDNVEIKLPFKPEYVSIARLAAYGVSNRMGFDIESIEDIKVAVAEVCNKLVLAGSKASDSYRITFAISDSCLEIIFNCEDKSLKCIFEDDKAGLGVSIIKALMDEVEICTGNSSILVMGKSLKGDC